METPGRPIYYLNVPSLKVPNKSLHFRESGDLMITIWVLTEATCSYRLLHPSNLANDGCLKLYGTGTSHILYNRGWGSNTSDSSTMFVSCWSYWIWRILSSKFWFWQRRSFIKAQIYAMTFPSLLDTSLDGVALFLFIIMWDEHKDNTLFKCSERGLIIFTRAQRWAPIVLFKSTNAW